MQSHILNILASNPTQLHFPFSITLHTSFSYTISNQQKINRSILIGWHQGTNTTLHLFLTSSIENTHVFFTYLDSINTYTKMTCLKNIYSMSHITKKPPLKSNFCVCAHSKNITVYCTQKQYF
jgi:hypothetical protein